MQALDYILYFKIKIYKVGVFHADLPKFEARVVFMSLMVLLKHLCFVSEQNLLY